MLIDSNYTVFYAEVYINACNVKYLAVQLLESAQGLAPARNKTYK